MRDRTGNVRNAKFRLVRATIFAVEKQNELYNLSTQHATCMRHIVVSGLPGCTIFLHIIS